MLAGFRFGVFLCILSIVIIFKSSALDVVESKGAEDTDAINFTFNSSPHLFEEEVDDFFTSNSVSTGFFAPCSALSSPVNGATNVPVETVIAWEDTPGNFGYIISLGTSSGGTEILPPTAVGFNNYSPLQGLPENTLIYVNIQVRDTESTSIICDEQSFRTGSITQLPDCTNINSPANGAIDVPLSITLSWDYAPRATSYRVQLGTSAGASDVLDIDTMSNALNYFIPFDLVDNTTYYARVIPQNAIGALMGCQEISFTTIVLDDSVPACTQLITPEDGAEGVAFTPLLTWSPVDNADGYRLTIGTAPGNADVLDNANLGDVTSTLVLDFDSGTLYYVRVVPFNSAGPAVNCPQTSFTTALGCGPYLDPNNGQLVDLNPRINLEDNYVLCINDGPLQLEYEGDATEYRWLQLTENAELELSLLRNVTISEEGNYRLEVIKEIPFDDGNLLRCEASHDFTVTTSEAATITAVDIRNQGFNFRLTVDIEGSSQYEYALALDGPYQDSNTFNNVNLTDTTVYVRDKNGCGVVSQRIVRDRGFPKYFTPNGDGINDFWQVRGVKVEGEIVTEIAIFDRYGKKITQFSARGSGWDGTYGGKQLFDGGFWYQAFTESNVVFTGYFALRR